MKVGTAATIAVNGNAAFAGVTTVGTALSFGDGVKAQFGNSGDLKIYHDAGGQSRIEESGSSVLKIMGSDLRLSNTANSKDYLQANDGSYLRLYHDGNIRLETTGSGVNITNDLNAAGISTFGGVINAGSGDITLTSTVGSGSSTILFDTSAGTVTFQDNLRAQFGTGSDLKIYHDGIDSYITSATGDLKITDTSDDITLTAADDIRLRPQGGESGVDVIGNGEVILYHNSNARVTTTDDGTDFGGTGSIRVPNGTTGERNSSPAAGDFRYNTTTGKFEGYTDSWGDIGGSGGVDETDTSVSTTSATSCGSFAIASFRSASIIAQITQGSNYQVGRYLVIHDGTTVTTIEESAVATGSMLGTFEGVINSSNLEFRVTMSSSSSATVTTKIDTVTV